ncbi:MAG TPA: hypothetical protein VG276_15340 [Actinomycetes bacterium]|nr:hypothetical protein [Actinomycetes bacterium]
MRVGQTGSGATSDGPPATDAGGSSWCPRCDDLAETATTTPCAACATPRVKIGPIRRDPAGPDRIRRAGRCGGAPAEPSWWLDTVTEADPAASAAAAARSVEAAAARSVERDGEPGRPPVGSDPAGVAPTGTGVDLDAAQVAPTATGFELDPARVAPTGTGVGPGSDLGGSGGAVAAPPRPAAAVPPAAGQRWLVGLLVLVLGAGAVAVRGASFAPAERRTAGTQVAAPAPAVAQPSRQRARDPLYGFPVVPEQAARPLRTLPARGLAPVPGASGSMVVRYGGWLWRQRLSGGPASPVGPAPASPVLALSPDGEQLALVHTLRGRAMVEVRAIDGRVHLVVNGSGPAWSLDGRLAYVRTPSNQRAVAMTMSLSRSIPRPELRVVAGATWSTVPLPAAPADAQAGWTGDGDVLLLGRDGSQAGLFRVDVSRNRLEPLSPARAGAALARGLPRAADAAGPLGGALAGVPVSLVALAPDGRRVALVTRTQSRSRLDVIGSSGRASIDLPADRFKSVHWAPGGNLVWLHGAGHLWAVNVAKRRVAARSPGLPRGADVLGLVP